VDEYELEITELRRSLARLRVEQAAQPLIDEYEVELRILVALYEAATRTMDIGAGDGRMAGALAGLGFGEWELDNVYAFVYEAAMEADTEGRDLGAAIGETDFPALLLAAPERQPG
jgi:hypothetical protein